MIRGRLHRRPKEGRDEGRAEQVVEIDARALSGLFTTPGWLRDLGVTSWLLVGVTLLLVGLVWLMSLTSTIVLPVITAAVVAAVASPLVDAIARRVPRAVAAILMLVALIALGIGFVVLIVGGITSQAGDVSDQLSGAKDTIQGWLNDLGVDPGSAKSATDDASSSVSNGVSGLLQGIAGGIKELSSLAFFLALTALSLVFLLKDGPMIRSWVERHSGVPTPIAHTVSERVLQSLRGYFLGVTIVAAFNAVVV
jgi:putative heme transporter